MFGLMKACSCNKSSEERELHRLHYCGTCKTIGHIYGQKARLFLNFDAVFLGELLAALQPSKTQFAPAYVSKNCLALPQRSQIPWALEYAAASNVVLAQYKLIDHVADTGSKVLNLALRVYTQEFQRAKEALVRCHFPFEQLQNFMSLQIGRERESRPSLDRLAEPTAGATKLVFYHGAVTSGAEPQTAATMASLGTTFGEIAYLVDAIQDQGKDLEKGAFNALAATGMTGTQAKRILRSKLAVMLSCLNALPIDDGRKRDFTNRIKSNLAPYLFMRRRPDRVVIIREDRRPSFCGSCGDAICCCETIQCCDCLSAGCGDCLCAGCGILR